MITALLVDDESRSQATLTRLLTEYCPEIHITGTAGSVAEGVRAIDRLRPEIVFLDIALPDGDGFNLLDELPEKNFEVIFTTAHHEFATRAFELAALHYLLKPINPEELRKAVARYNRMHSREKQHQQYDIFRKGLNNQFQKIALPSLEGITFIDLRNIIRCEASESYTIFHLEDKSRIVVSKSLNKYEKLLSDSFFYRIHDKHLINLHHVKKYVRGKGGNVLLTDGFSADVSVRRKEDFLQRIAELTGSL